MELEIESRYWLEAARILKIKFQVPEPHVTQMSNEILDEIKKVNCDTYQSKPEHFWKNFYTYASKKSKNLISNMSKNFGLSENQFNQMKVDLQNGDEAVFEQIFLNHFESCVKYLINNQRIDYELAYDLSMDTLLEFRKKLINDKISYGNLRFLFTRMASQRHLKLIAKEKKQEGLSSFYEDENIEPDLVILEKSLAKLGDNCRDILKLNYYDQMSLNNIAELKGITHAAIRKQKQRCIFALKNLFRQHSL